MTIVAIIPALLFAAWQWISSRDPSNELVRVCRRSHYRICEARLTGFPYAPPAHESPADRGHELAALARRLESRTDSRAMCVRGVALLLAGEEDLAVATLRKTTARHLRDASAWNDLAVALQSAANGGQVSLLPQALGAVRRALILQPDFQEARFNEGILLEKLGLNADAIRAYETYLTVDDSTRWADEARQRIAEIDIASPEDFVSIVEKAASAANRAAILDLVARHPSKARSAALVLIDGWAIAARNDDWTKASRHLRTASAIAQALFIVQGDSFYRDCVAVIENSANDRRSALILTYILSRSVTTQRDWTADALPPLVAAEAQFLKSGSPMKYEIAIPLLMELYHPTRGSIGEEKAWLHLLASTPTTYYGIRAHILLSMASVYRRRGRLPEALRANEEALMIYRTLRDDLMTALSAFETADTLSMLGRRNDAWIAIIAGFKASSRYGDRFLISSHVKLVAQQEATAGNMDAAFALLALSTEESLDERPRYTPTNIWRGLAAYRSGEVIKTRLYEAAVQVAGRVRDPDSRRQAVSDLLIIDAIVHLQSNDPRRAIALMDRYGKETQSGYFQSEARFLRALALRRLGDERAAVNELRTCLASLEWQQADAEQRATNFRTREEVTAELVDLLVRHGDVKGAFRALGDARRQPHRRPGLVSNPTDSDLLIVEYLALHDRLLIFIARHNAVSLRTVDVSDRQLHEVASAFTDDVFHGNTSTAGQDLFRWLITPIADLLSTTDLVVVVPDRILARIPFAALRSKDGRYLIEQAALVMAPSNSLAARPTPIADGTTIIVGDPSNDFRYAPLPYARREAKALAQQYAGIKLLLGKDATWNSVFAAAPDASVMHFATHAVVGPDDTPSYLILSPSNLSGIFEIREIQHLRLWRNPLIVLAGCRTGVPANESHETRSLALAFVAAGASSVVGTLWDLPDDAASVEASVRLHHGLVKGLNPAQALRTVQLAMLRSPDKLQREPARWSAFQLWSTTPNTFTGTPLWIDPAKRKRTKVATGQPYCLARGCQSFEEPIARTHVHRFRCAERACKFFRQYVAPKHVHTNRAVHGDR